LGCRATSIDGSLDAGLTGIDWLPLLLDAPRRPSPRLAFIPNSASSPAGPRVGQDGSANKYILLRQGLEFVSIPSPSSSTTSSRFLLFFPPASFSGIRSAPKEKPLRTPPTTVHPLLQAQPSGLFNLTWPSPQFDIAPSQAAPLTSTPRAELKFLRKFFFALTFNYPRPFVHLRRPETPPLFSFRTSPPPPPHPDPCCHWSRLCLRDTASCPCQLTIDHHTDLPIRICGIVKQNVHPEELNPQDPQGTRYRSARLDSRIHSVVQFHSIEQLFRRCIVASHCNV
jgi:hypothetical protein